VLRNSKDDSAASSFLSSLLDWLFVRMADDSGKANDYVEMLKFLVSNDGGYYQYDGKVGTGRYVSPAVVSDVVQDLSAEKGKTKEQQPSLTSQDLPAEPAKKRKKEPEQPTLRCDFCNSDKNKPVSQKSIAQDRWNLFTFCSTKPDCMDKYNNFMFRYDLQEGLPYAYRAKFKSIYGRAMKTNGPCWRCQNTKKTVEIPFLYEQNFFCTTDDCFQRFMRRRRPPPL
jgi:hypothetical protein